MKKEEQKIVVAVDESEESMYALSWCLENLVPHNNKSTLVLLYVKPPPTVYALDAAGYMFASDAVSALEKCGSDLVNSVMARAQAVIRNFDTDNTNLERITGSGDAKDVICSTVKKLGADTLVMGSHGYGFFKRALLGSVSDYCAKHAECPVVIVKHPDDK
ncbi:hypothetical protein I3760_07G115300 [Carya illinoinensis]|uniref:UspA domain-containing protein n=1 Tax=Carya illinoinensis TaxID=32201 RepID=A0A8T1Q4R8_CARIL|nr:universal stress protein A-like protein [Carya illinoinensis]KAG2697627.1 hypothetical protein I3760_07G115300 [Carya illinoinensis]KAG6647990.1 hypothetical protein CIPAW_07G116600 [Carya illinoinensis]